MLNNWLIWYCITMFLPNYCFYCYKITKEWHCYENKSIILSEIINGKLSTDKNFILVKILYIILCNVVLKSDQNPVLKCLWIRLLEEDSNNNYDVIMIVTLLRELLKFTIIAKKSTWVWKDNCYGSTHIIKKLKLLWIVLIFF